MEIEINFRFDENGRTANTKVAEGTNNNNSNGINYDFKAEMTDLKDWCESPDSSTSKKSMMDEILLDCEISDNMIMPRTYWMPADGTPRCALEQFALDVFEHHVPEDFAYDKGTSGAEWWCQLRPSPETGRHKACAEDNDTNDKFNNGISFHVDKDEELRILTGGSTYVHPHLSTITYLTNIGSPTLMINCQVHPLTGEWIVPEDLVEGFVSWPSVGKHTSFDGRYLHASPLDLMGEEDAFSKQLASTKALFGAELSKAQKRRCRRVTFLVNIWLNYKPYDVNPFPESMLDKMSGLDKDQRRGLSFDNRSSPALHVQETSVRADKATETPPSANETDYTAKAFSWPLGDKQSGEKLDCRVPFKSIISAASTGSSVRIQWQRKSGDDCFVLFDGKSSEAATEKATEAGKTKEGIVSRETKDGKNQNDATEEQSKKRPRGD